MHSVQVQLYTPDLHATRQSPKTQSAAWSQRGGAYSLLAGYRAGPAQRCIQKRTPRGPSAVEIER